MCGIAGGILFNRQTFNRTVLQKMTDVIRHRGPDDSGIYVDGGVGLGFRRLSIIDLSPAGHQPMAAVHDQLWITFNGEIYNFEILRADLERSGVTFKSDSDTEVILQLYLKYGTACFEKLRGMFGIAIWDARKNTLTLARDRVGKKPLYYYIDKEKLLFASELKSIYQYPGLNYSINEEALAEYFSYGFIASPRSIYKAVAKLKPGCFLEVDLSGKTNEGSFWKFTPPTRPKITSFEDAKQLVFDKVDESIKLRMRSDVPIGAFLSGGIDSTIVVARMAQHTDKPVKTFTIGFKDKAFDESEYAALVAKRYNTEHHLEVIDPDYADLIEDILCNFDEPFGDSSALPTHVVSKMISKHVTVALSGDGGDEAFGGYEIYQEILESKRFERIPAPVRKMARFIDPIYPDTLPGRNYLRRFSITDPYQRFIERYKLISDPERKKLLKGPSFTDTSVFKRSLFDELKPGTEFLAAMRYNDMKHYLEGDIMVKVDRTTMQNSIESRAPLLDHELLELTFDLQDDFLIRNGSKKYILKEAFRDHIPEELFSRPKKGFSLPVADWLRGELKGYFEDIVFGEGFAKADFIDKAYVKHLFNIHQSKRRDLSFHLWLILSFAIWYQKVYQPLINRRSQSADPLSKINVNHTA